MTKSGVQQKPIAAADSGPDMAQRAASDPAASVWVAASAGSGKTKVLTDRVLRLLLPRADGQPGTPPHKILCLTFTKAGAGEMALRLNTTLGKWAVQRDLAGELKALLGRVPTDGDITAARQLFARVVDVPGGLKILTLHSFCQSVLGRFPLEAGLPPHFTVLEEAEASMILDRARQEVLGDALRVPETPLGHALAAVAASQNGESFDALLGEIAKERKAVSEILEQAQGTEGLYRNLCRFLDIDPALDDERLLHAFCSGGFDEAGLRRACAAFATRKSDNDQAKGVMLQQWLDADPAVRVARIEDYKDLFLTQKRTLLKTLITKKPHEVDPEIVDVLTREAARVLTLSERQKALACAQMTRDLFMLGEAILLRYQDLKARRGGLDFDDLILRTRALFRADGMPGWVLYKLDGGIDHILIDEAQDTNPEQWDIVEALAAEFFAGTGARDQGRTLFVVGDQKQSIYGFQRAAPEKFRDKHGDFRVAVQDAGQVWKDIPLNTSFRSTAAVLRLVDAVFADGAARAGLGADPVRHVAHREGEAGRVTLWPLLRGQDATDDDATLSADPWAALRNVRETPSASHSLAAHVADQVAGWLRDGEILSARGRAVAPGDILILMRKRSSLLAQMIRALHARGVPVAGVDRLVLGEELAVQDLLAVAGAALLPADDLTLACVLKSPFCGWDDAMLERVAAGRAGTLWQALAASSAPESAAARAWLTGWRAQAGSLAPYEFFSSVLQQSCPAAPTRSGLFALTGRLGDEIMDPVEEFLNRALGYETAGAPTLQHFLIWQQQKDMEIKREQEEAAGKVRIMTVHAAKGLQAPIVILPDTVPAKSGPGGARAAAARLLWPARTGLPVPLWSAREATDFEAYSRAHEIVKERTEEEERRLFYVALTRAEDRLYIGGYMNLKTLPAGCWYDMAAAGFGRLGAVAAADGAMCLEDRQTAAPRVPKAAPRPTTDVAAIDLAVMPWAFNYPLPDDPARARPAAPSHLTAGDDLPALSPLLSADQHRFARGNLTHRLLQVLPDLPPERRTAAAERFIVRQGKNLPENVRSEIVREVLAIFDDPAYAPLFGLGSAAEVPLAGTIDGIALSGQADRILVTASAVWIVDYKTNRPPPVRAEDIPPAYHAQMKAYRDILTAIYPDRPIRTFLLWTDGPRLLELP